MPRLRQAEDEAFDRWLETHLRASRQAVLNEPVPQELLRLLQERSQG